MPKLKDPQKEARARAREADKIHDAMLSNAVDLLKALHEADFRSVFIESLHLGDGSSAFVYLWIDRDEMSSDEMFSLSEIADMHDAKLSLGKPLGVNSPSRIRVWPSQEG
jgi:hypothetical protein